MLFMGFGRQGPQLKGAAHPPFRVERPLIYGIPIDGGFLRDARIGGI